MHAYIHCRLLEFEPSKRISAREALQHPFFDISDADDCLDSPVLSPSPVPPCITMAPPPPVNLERNPSSGSQSEKSERCAPKSGNVSSSDGAKEWSDYQVLDDTRASEAKSDGQSEGEASGAGKGQGQGQVVSRTASSDIGSSTDTVIRDDAEGSNVHVHHNSSSAANLSQGNKSESRGAPPQPHPQVPVPPRRHTLVEKQNVVVGSDSDYHHLVKSSGQTESVAALAHSDKVPMRPAAMHEKPTRTTSDSETSRQHNAFGRSLSSENTRNAPQQGHEDMGASKRPSSERITTTSHGIAPAHGQGVGGKNINTAMVRGAKGVAREL